jgi:hypothetical protein
LRQLSTGPNLAITPYVNLFGYESRAESDLSLRHEFVIGPLRHHYLFKHDARHYYCIRCKWTFLICGTEVVVLDDNGSPLADDEGTRRFKTFQGGPCPVLEALVAQFFGSTSSSITTESGRNSNEYGNLAPGNVHSRVGGFGPLLRIFDRLRGDLRRLA